MNNLNLRKENETFLLYSSVLILIVISYFILEISFILLAFLVIVQLGYVLVAQRQYLGNALLVNEEQFPTINNIVSKVCKNLDVDTPSVFIQQDPYINAFAIGFKKPFSIVLSSSLVEALDEGELEFVIAHEVGHIKLGHTKWISLISPLGQNNPFLSFIYGPWQRTSEYSADRAGISCVRKVPTTIKAMIKMAVGEKLSKEVNVGGLIKQIEKGESSTFSSVGELFLTHPYILNRIESLIGYYQSIKDEESI